MWNGKMKALTFSYDDGVEQDIRLIEILDRYHLRGTFNLQSRPAKPGAYLPGKGQRDRAASAPGAVARGV